MIRPPATAYDVLYEAARRCGYRVGLSSDQMGPLDQRARAGRQAKLRVVISQRDDEGGVRIIGTSFPAEAGAGVAKAAAQLCRELVREGKIS